MQEQTPRPSKYHQWIFIGHPKEQPYVWHWDSLHPDLEPTSVFWPGSYSSGTPFCVYCCAKAHPIQKAYTDIFLCTEYELVGYCCICDAAEAEKELRQQRQEMERRHKEEIKALDASFKERLREDKQARFDLHVALLENDFKRSDGGFYDFKKAFNSKESRP